MDSIHGERYECCHDRKDREGFHQQEDVQPLFRSTRFLHDSGSSHAIVPHSFQSFRNLDLALEQARANSLRDNHAKVHDANDQKYFHHKNSIYESFRDLDDATALAIQNSLADKPGARGLFESFRNLDGAMAQAMKNSLGPSAEDDIDDDNDGRGGGLFESFRNLDAAMAQAMKNSLSEPTEQGLERSAFLSGASAYSHLARLEESDSEDDDDSGNELDANRRSQMRCLSGSIHDMVAGKEVRRRTSVESTQVSVGVEHVNEAAPNLSRISRRHANKRFEENRRHASLTFGEEEDEEEAEKPASRGGGRSSRAAGLSNSSSSNRSAGLSTSGSSVDAAAIAYAASASSGGGGDGGSSEDDAQHRRRTVSDRDVDYQVEEGAGLGSSLSRPKGREKPKTRKSLTGSFKNIRGPGRSSFKLSKSDRSAAPDDHNNSSYDDGSSRGEDGGVSPVKREDSSFLFGGGRRGMSMDDAQFNETKVLNPLMRSKMKKDKKKKAAS